jgi:uncharacterized Zn finger protein
MATHARILPRSAATARARTWWAKAWVRAVEEAAYGEEDLRKGRALARAGRVGGITLEAGRFLAAVEEGDDALTVTGGLPVLDERGLTALTETVAAESGRIAALLAGDLPHGLVEHAEEVGVELLPYSGEFSWGCTCDAWLDPCRHALAVGYQLAWLVDADPFVLLALRGLSREDLLARLHERDERRPEVPDDLALALDAATRANRILQLLDAGDLDVEHLL